MKSEESEEKLSQLEQRLSEALNIPPELWSAPYQLDKGIPLSEFIYVYQESKPLSKVPTFSAWMYLLMPGNDERLPEVKEELEPYQAASKTYTLAASPKSAPVNISSQGPHQKSPTLSRTARNNFQQIGNFSTQIAKMEQTEQDAASPALTRAMASESQLSGSRAADERDRQYHFGEYQRAEKQLNIQNNMESVVPNIASRLQIARDLQSNAPRTGLRQPSFNNDSVPEINRGQSLLVGGLQMTTSELMQRLNIRIDPASRVQIRNGPDGSAPNYVFRLMGHHSMHTLFTKDTARTKIKEGAAITIGNYRDVAVRFGWKRAGEDVTKAIAGLETRMREARNDIVSWETTLREIAPRTADEIFRADVAINVIVGQLCKVSMMLVMHRIAYKQYLREAVLDPPEEQSDSKPTNESWWDEFIDEDAVDAHGLFVSSEKFKESCISNQDTVSQNTQGDVMNNPTMHLTSCSADHDQVGIQFDCSLSTIDTTSRDDEVVANHQPASYEDTGVGGLIETMLDEQAAKDLYFAKTNSNEQKKEQARLSLAAAKTLKTLREARIMDLINVEDAGQDAPGDIIESGARDIMIKQPEIRLEELSVNKIQPINEDNPVCTFCEYDCDWGTSYEKVCTSADEAKEICNECQDSQSNFMATWNDLGYNKSYQDTHYCEPMDIDTHRKLSNNDGKDITKFQSIQLCKYATYTQVDVDKARICEDCRLKKLTIIGHRHMKLLPVIILRADDSFLDNLKAQYNHGRVEGTEIEKVIADQVNDQSNRQKKTFDLTQRRCMVCTNLATSICDGCPLKLCDTCEVLIRSSDCDGWLDNLIYTFRHAHIRSDAFLLRGDGGGC